MRSGGFALALRQDKDALLGEQICQAPVRIEGIWLAVTVKSEAALNPHADLVAHRHEVADRAEMDVGRVVPRMRQEMRHRHPATKQKVQPDPPKAEIRERDDRAPANADERLEHLARLTRGLQGLAQHDDVESAGRIGGEIAIGIPLNDRKPVADTGVAARLAELHAAAVDSLVANEMGEQRAVAAADIEHARAGLDHLRDELQIVAELGARTAPDQLMRFNRTRSQRGVATRNRRHHDRVSPRCSAQPVKKPRRVSNSSGSCSRNASCPLSVSISTKLTLAAAAFSARTSSRLSDVGNSQSLVKEMMQKREGVPLKAFANAPACSAARSK